MTTSRDRLPKTIIDAAYEAYDTGTAGPGDRLIILQDVHHSAFHEAIAALPGLVAEAVVAKLPNGNGNGRGNGKRRWRDKLKEKAPALTRGGIAGLIIERIVNTMI